MARNSSGAKVVLFFPPYDGPPVSAPACLLAVAAPLLQEGFEVVLVDGSIEPDFLSRVLIACRDAIVLGISLLTGPMIFDAIRLAQAVKAQRPELPIIFGGWHPSLASEQTLHEPYVDAIVRGQGEVTFLECVRRFATGESLAGLSGLSHKQERTIVHEPERRVSNINDLPAPAYHLGDYDAYERVTGVRRLAYTSSVGCPYACNYCTDQVFYKRKFNAYRAERVVQELSDLVRHYQFEEISFCDSNLLVDVKRAIAIAAGLVDSGVKFRWNFQASTDFLCRMSDAEVRLLAEAGVHHIGFGTESASQQVLLLMNKKFQKVEHIEETARKTAQAGIRSTFNVILGYPGETEADRVKTFAMMTRLAGQFGNVNFSPNVFTPYPGIAIWPELRELGVREPRSLREWADLPLGKNVLPWLTGRELDRMRRMLHYFLLNNQISNPKRKVSGAVRKLRRIVSKPLAWRIRNNKYSVPLELWLANWTSKVTARRSLFSGQELSHDMSDVC